MTPSNTKKVLFLCFHSYRKFVCFLVMLGEQFRIDHSLGALFTESYFRTELHARMSKNKTWH